MSESSSIRCGTCGNDTVRLSGQMQGEGRHNFTRIDLTCTKCGEVSHIRIPEPQPLRFSFGENSIGVLCAGWEGRYNPSKDDK